MSAEVLRRTADMIRDEDPGCKSMHGCPWHGPVALAVADWLDRSAIYSTGEAHSTGPVADLIAPAIAVARAYLGDDA